MVYTCCIYLSYLWGIIVLSNPLRSKVLVLPLLAARCSKVFTNELWQHGVLDDPFFWWLTRRDLLIACLITTRYIWRRVSTSLNFFNKANFHVGRIILIFFSFLAALFKANVSLISFFFLLPIGQCFLRCAVVPEVQNCTYIPEAKLCLGVLAAVLY